MAQVSSKIRIGIIGSDTSHTLAFINEFKKYPGYEVSWVDINNRTDLEFSINRSKEIIKDLKDLDIPLITNLNQAEEVDAYCVLTLDAKTHPDILNIIKDSSKPIFIDKPIFYKLEYFNNLSNLVFSSSALRYTDFIQKAVLENKDSQEDIHIEGPLSFIEGIDGYFWYGIHLVEMLHTLSTSNVELEEYQKLEDYELIQGNSKGRKFSLKGITVGDPEFKVILGDKSYSISDDDKNIYENLVCEILEFFKDKESRVNGQKIIETVIKINEMRNNYA